jgi:outer membrane biosynthesis protein TonB
MDIDGAPRQPRPFWESERTPPWLVSLVAHTLVLILLALWQLPKGTSNSLTIFARGDASEAADAVAIRAPQTEDAPSASDNFSPQPVTPTNPSETASSPDPADTPDPSNTLEPPEPPEPPAPQSPPPATTAIAETEPLRIDPAMMLATDGDAAPSDPIAREALELLASVRGSGTDRPGNPAAGGVLGVLRMPKGGISDRTVESRAELGARYGATRQSEAAVEAALQWLAQHQKLNGSWSFHLQGDPCRGRCTHSAAMKTGSTPSTAATGLALLAFMGAGYTHHEGEHAETVRRGIYYLLQAGQKVRFGLDFQEGSMYGHGIATLALTEVLNIDRKRGREDAEIRRVVEDAVLFTMNAQHTAGGWRYVPGSPGDMTVSGWQILSLVSARYAGVPLRTDTAPMARAFLNSLATPGSFRFGYTSTAPEPTTTAIGLASLLYLGESPFQTPFQIALWDLVHRGPKLGDVYHDYYAALALHNVRHEGWDQWHTPLREFLIRTQATQGHEKGSWHFEDPHGDVGGRLYTTAMAALILEVYYRHLPLYQEQDEDAFPLN